MKAMGILSGCWIAVISAVSASAHPHVFIDAKANFVADQNGYVTALQITWTYDAFTSLSLQDLLDLDLDSDGVLSDADLARVVKAQTVWPDGFKGDTYLEQDGIGVALARPVNGTAWQSDINISVAFELPVEEPFLPGQDVTLRLYDPSYYYAYSAVDVQGTEQCSAFVAAFEPDKATSKLRRQLARLSREEKPEQAGIGRMFADVIRLDCD